MERKPHPAEEWRRTVVLNALPYRCYESAPRVRRKIWNDFATPEERAVATHRVERYLDLFVREGLAESRVADGRTLYRRRRGCRWQRAKRA